MKRPVQHPCILKQPTGITSTTQLPQKPNKSPNTSPCNRNSAILKHTTNLTPKRPSLMIARIIIQMILPIQPLMRVRNSS